MSTKGVQSTPSVRGAEILPSKILVSIETIIAPQAQICVPILSPCAKGPCIMRFDKRISVKTDHFSVLNLSLASSTSVFFELGFVRGGGRTALDQKVMEMTAPTVRFVFDNAYIECVQFPPEISEFYNYLSTPVGIHIAALLTPDAEATRQRLWNSGIEVDELDRAVRENVDYGDKPGPVIFQMVPLPEEIIPRTHLAFLEHLTHDLMYQPTRCAHLNGVTRMVEAVLCCEDPEDARRIGEELPALCALADNSSCPGGMESLRIMDPQSFREEFGMEHNPQGSPFAALCFGTPSLEDTGRYLNLTAYRHEKLADRIRVWPPARLGLVFDFIQL